MSTSTPTATVHALKPNTAAYFEAEAGEAEAAIEAALREHAFSDSP
mgnify:CR=1 FL=1